MERDQSSPSPKARPTVQEVQRLTLFPAKSKICNKYRLESLMCFYVASRAGFSGFFSTLKCIYREYKKSNWIRDLTIHRPIHSAYVP